MGQKAKINTFMSEKLVNSWYLYSRRLSRRFVEYISAITLSIALTILYKGEVAMEAVTCNIV